MDVSQPLTILDENNVNKIEQNRIGIKGYFRQLRESFRLTYFKVKWFDDEHWKLAFCSSSFNCINNYPTIFLVYRTFLFLFISIHLIYDLMNIHPTHEWPIYYTNQTLLITFFAILFQFIITCRVNFYRANDIVPPCCLQYIHVTLLILSLSSGLSSSIIYWIFIKKLFTRIPHIREILSHGIVWFLLFIDVFLFTRLPIYMIDLIPLAIFSTSYSIFTLIVYFFRIEFSAGRIGYIYRAINLNNSSKYVIIIIFFLLVFFIPLAVLFALWNSFGLRRAINAKKTNKTQHLNNQSDI